MKKITLLILLCLSFDLAIAQKNSKSGPVHFICIQTPDTYHDQEHCATLQMCSGGKIRKTRNVESLKPCRKCARPVYLNTSFDDIKRILGVKDKKQIVDSIGTDESLIKRSEGFTMRISGPPESRTVNMLEFFMTSSISFSEDTLLSKQFFKRLGFVFEGCKADTIRSSTAHPVTGKIKKDFSIEYRGCANVEQRDKYEDTSKYFYELTFFAKELDRSAVVEKIQLLLKVENP
jgi:hypothetical protein